MEFFDFDSAVPPESLPTSPDYIQPSPFNGTLDPYGYGSYENVPPINQTNGAPWMQSGIHLLPRDSFDPSLHRSHSLGSTSENPFPDANQISGLDYVGSSDPSDIGLGRNGTPLMSPLMETEGINEQRYDSDLDQRAYAAMNTNNQEINSWFAQVGRRDSKPRKGLPRRRSLYSRQPSQPVTIPAAITRQPDADWKTLDPLQRWQNSPPENEAASISAISNAVAATDLNQYTAVESGGNSNVSTPGIEPKTFNLAPKRSSRPASVSSIESGTSNGSMESMMSSWSCGSRVSGTSSNRKNGRSNARVTKPRNRTAPTGEARVFQCTFCCDTFKTRYDWTRHEKSLHLNLEKWVCLGGIIECPSTGKPLCSYCLSVNPTEEHLDTHNHKACANKPAESKSFKRKDHLIQHLRLLHKVETLPEVGQWKAPEVPIKSRCGFCDLVMNDWKTRSEHLSKHFRDGHKMAAWHGTHGFEPEVARQVSNAMPPFLIGHELTTPIPFSASNPHHKELVSQMTARSQLMNSLVGSGVAGADQADCESPELKNAWEFLTFHLGRYAQEKVQQGIVPTDEMFQRESRRIWYDSDDPWNQTVADHSEWMELFRKEHGLYLDTNGNTALNNGGASSR